jgi:hypothetical protein
MTIIHDMKTLPRLVSAALSERLISALPIIVSISYTAFPSAWLHS